MPTHTLWSKADETHEEELFLAGRSAFWLFPERWEGVNPFSQPMNFDDGTWQPPAEPEMGPKMCRNCFSYKCTGCAPMPAVSLPAKAPPPSEHGWLIRALRWLFPEWAYTKDYSRDRDRRRATEQRLLLPIISGINLTREGWLDYDRYCVVDMCFDRPLLGSVYCPYHTNGEADHEAGQVKFKQRGLRDRVPGPPDRKDPGPFWR